MSAFWLELKDWNGETVKSQEFDTDTPGAVGDAIALAIRYMTEHMERTGSGSIEWGFE